MEAQAAENFPSPASGNPEVPAPVIPLFSAGRVDVIDGLRGIAILQVAWFHFWQLSWQGTSITWFGRTFNVDFLPVTGFVGVQLFFFLSGFCLLFPYAKAQATGQPVPSPKEFYFRRAWKIVPSYSLFIGVLLACGWNQYDLSEPRRFWAVLGSHVFFVHNLLPEWGRAINSVLWSLGVEVQFYLLFPLLWRAFLRWPWTAWLIGCVAANVFRFSLTALALPQAELWFNQLPAVVDLFLTGMLVAALYARGGAHALKSLPVIGRTLPALAVATAGLGAFLGLLYFGYALRYEKPGFQLWEIHSRFPIAFAVGLWALGTLLARGNWARFFSQRILRYFSAISYNLYLWHAAIAYLLLHYKIPVPSTDDPHRDRAWVWAYFWICWIAAIGFSTLVTYAWERPWLRFGHQRLKRQNPG